MNNDSIKNIALYTRVSTEDQAKEGYSLDAQLKSLRALCVSKGWNIQGEYIDDGYSGRNPRRPKYKEMLKNIKEWDGLLVMKMDRIHRNSKNFMEMMDFLKKNSKEFISNMESLDTSTAMGRFVMDIIQRIAQLESEQDGERVTIAMDHKSQDLNESYAGGRPAFGYDFDDGKIIPVPEKLELVKRAWEIYSQDGIGINRVCKELYGPQPVKNSKNQRQYGNVRYWFTNAIYVGYHQWTNHFKLLIEESAISLDLWNIVQTKRCKARGRSRKFKPFIFKERVPYFYLTDEELVRFGLQKHKKKHNIGK